MRCCAAASLRPRQPNTPARSSRGRWPTHGIICSMSRSGDVWDYAAMESFFFSLKSPVEFEMQAGSA